LESWNVKGNYQSPCKLEKICSRHRTTVEAVFFSHPVAPARAAWNMPNPCRAKGGCPRFCKKSGIPEKLVKKLFDY
jgi:hypothetical protein